MLLSICLLLSKLATYISLFESGELQDYFYNKEEHICGKVIKAHGVSHFSTNIEVYGHRSLSILQEMDAKDTKGTSLPCKLAPLPGRCPICDAAGMTKIPRGPLSDTTELPV